MTQTVEVPGGVEPLVVHPAYLMTLASKTNTGSGTIHGIPERTRTFITTGRNRLLIHFSYRDILLLLIYACGDVFVSLQFLFGADRGNRNLSFGLEGQRLTSELTRKTFNQTFCRPHFLTGQNHSNTDNTHNHHTNAVRRHI